MGLRQFVMLVGFEVRVWSLIWSKDSRGKCLVRFVGFVGACGVWNKGVIPCMARGSTVLVSSVVKGVCGPLWAPW